MGTRNCLWHFILSLVLCTKTVMALEGGDATTANPESLVNALRSTNDSTTGQAAKSSNASMAEPSTQTAHSLLGTTLLSPSMMRMVSGEGRTDTTPTTPTREGSSLGMSPGSGAVSPAFPTAGPGTTAPSMGTGSGTASSLSLSSAVTSRSPTSSSSSSSSPEGSPAGTPSPQQSSTSGTTATPLATTSHPPTALVFSSWSSMAAITSAWFSAVTAEAMTQVPTNPRPVASASGSSPTSGTMENRIPPTLGSSTETSTAQLTSTQGQALVEETAASSPTRSPLPSMNTASVGSSAMIPPGDRESSTMNQGSRTTTEPNIKTSLPATSLVSPSTMRMVSGEGRTDTTPTTLTREGSSQGMSPGSSAVSPAFPTAGPGTTASSMGTGSGTASSLSLSTAVMSSSSSSSSSPEGFSVGTPSPQRSNTSGTTATPLATTSHPPTALVFSTAGLTGMESDAVTTEKVTPSPAPSTNPVPSASIIPPASGITESSHSPTLSSSTETPAPRHTSALLTQGQTMVEVTATSSPTKSPLPSTATASVGSSATTPPGEGETSTMTQGSRTTAEPTAMTSHSLPSTTLATPSTTNSSTLTSVNPSSPGTCSPIALSIQLQNVTSTMIQFSWKPQGGTGDSPYTVRLLGKSGEMEKRVLNETSTAFENLLSGYQYQISVDVSTCSKNVSTSLRVQTAAEVYSGTTRIKNEEFKAAYQNKSSREFMEFETKFIMEITKHLPPKIQELKNGTKLRIVINSIKEGSVIILFDIVLDVEQNVTKPEISDAFTEALNRTTVFDIDLKKTVVEAKNSCQPGLNDCDQNAACTAEGGTYSCQCNEGFTDKSPQVPGRVCQQDLPSQQTTPLPPGTNTTKTTVTGSTTPLPPNTNTTSTTGTGSTTPLPPGTNTTNTTGTGSTTPLPPGTNTTNTTGTGSTTPLPSGTNTTSTTGTGSTTPLPPGTNTTNTTGTGSTTLLPPDTNTTNTTGTGSTTPLPPNTNTTNTTGTGSTTPLPPNTNTTNTTGTGSTTPLPPNTNTTNTTGTEHTTPVPPVTNTTGFTGSTSYSIFTTTFTSAPCMPVSVEVQKVTAEEIQLSWTSDSKGSLYSISVMDGNQEINKTTTKETKALFEHLLPGHVYTISVAVSSCAEDNHTSVTVRTDPASCFKRTELCSAESTGCSDLKDIVCSKNQALACRILLKNQKFNDTLYNSESEDYKTMAERIKRDVVGDMRAELSNNHFNIFVLGFRPGSVAIHFLSLLPKEEPVDADFIQTSLSKIIRNKFGDQTEVEVQSLSVQSSTDNCSSWRAAVIVLGVLLGVALVLILLAILFYIYMRRRSGIYFE